MGHTPETRRRELLKRQALRTAWLKEHGPCLSCGSSDDLEVDHIDPKKKIDHKVWSWSEDRRNAELTKCQVLCVTCHRQKHREIWSKHGASAYTTRKCRCDICRSWKSMALKRETRRKLGLRKSGRVAKATSLENWREPVRATGG